MSLNACHADFDNDGALDILLLRGGWEVPRRMSLLRNRGDGTFEDVTLSAGLGDADRHAGGRLGRLRQRRPRRPLRRRRVRRPAPRPAQPGPALPQPGRRHLRGRRRGGRRDQRPVRQGGRLGRLRRRRPARPLRLQPRAAQPALPQRRRRHVRRRRRRAGRDRAAPQLRLLVLGLRQRRPARPLGQPQPGDPLGRHPRPARPADRRASGPASIATSAGTCPSAT